MPKVAIVMGSKNDLEVCLPAETVLKKYGVDVEKRVISAHRTPDIAHDFAVNAEKNGIEIIIAAAGKSAHLAGVLAAFTTLPVIALPIKSSFCDGLDSLLSMVQMPSGIPVACVAINGGDNAGILAAQILGLKYPEIAAKLKQFKIDMANKIVEDDKSIQ